MELQFLGLDIGFNKIDPFDPLVTVLFGIHFQHEVVEESFLWKTHFFLLINHNNFRHDGSFKASIEYFATVAVNSSTK